jgi:methionyl-tRNA formyltransferase
MTLPPSHAESPPPPFAPPRLVDARANDDERVMDLPTGTRVVAVTQSDPFFTGTFFDSFLDVLSDTRVELVEIVVLPNFNESRLALARRVARLYGSRDFARLLARYAIARVREWRGRPQTVEGIARAHGIAVRRLSTINDPSYLATLRARGVRVLLSVAAPERFAPEALAAVPYTLNVHCGHLPRYRGMMPTFWALLHGEREVVITVHEMAPKIDAGGVLAEYPIPIRPEESAFELSRRMKEIAGRRVAELLADLGTNAWPSAHPLDMTQQRYHRFPTGADARRLRARGLRML